MKAVAALAATLALAAPAFARISGISAPSTVVQGQNISLTLFFEDYIQNNNDFGVVVGLARPEYDCARCAGTPLTFIDLYHDQTSLHGNKTFEIPTNGQGSDGSYEPDAGTYTLKVGDFYLVGASGGTSIPFWNSTITITSS